MTPDVGAPQCRFNACVSGWPDINEVRPGDDVEETQGDGRPRRGRIVDVLGGPGHQHFQVRWSARHESMVFPNERVRVIRRRTRRPA